MNFQKWELFSGSPGMLEIKWIEKAFPDEIEDFLVQTDTQLALDDDEESDEDNEVDE